jgi:ferric-dicitrate binding protein FerR (iron transport regulator)
MKYKDYTADDLIKDEYFQQWVFAPSEETNRFWIDYLENYPQHREKVEEARQFLSFFHVKDKDVFESRISNLKKRINVSIDQPEPAAIAEPKTEKKPQKKFSRARIRRIVMSAMMLVVGLIAVIMSFYPSHESSVVAKEDSDHRQIVAPRGKRELVVLGDGTRVFLNADSKLTFLKDFNSQLNREVLLEGQGYFEVAENLQKPFVVHTSGLSIKGVAGAFSVSAYADNSWIETILVEGKVSLESNLQPLNQTSLAPHQRVLFDKESENMSFDNQVDAANLTAWRTGRLVFENQSLRDIKGMLERWYDVTITFKDETSLGCHFSGQFDNKTLEEVLAILKTSEAVSFAVKGRDVTISGQLCE